MVTIAIRIRQELQINMSKTDMVRGVMHKSSGKNTTGINTKKEG